MVAPADWLFQRIAQIPQVRGLVFVFCLVVADGSGAARAPVHDALAAIHQSVAVPLAKNPSHGPLVVGAHGEFLIGKIRRASHALDLLDDDPAVFLAPLAALLDEGLAPYLEARDALGLELFVHLGLGGDARVIGAQDPARRISAHARVADVGVLDGVVEGMTHVQHARDVGRRDDDGAILICVRALARRARIPAALEPLRKDGLLVFSRVVSFGHLLVRHGKTPPLSMRACHTRSCAPSRASASMCAFSRTAFRASASTYFYASVFTHAFCTSASTRSPCQGARAPRGRGARAQVWRLPRRRRASRPRGRCRQRWAARTWFLARPPRRWP